VLICMHWLSVLDVLVLVIVCTNNVWLKRKRRCSIFFPRPRDSGLVYSIGARTHRETLDKYTSV
jgi:hypothetical protein